MNLLILRAIAYFALIVAVTSLKNNEVHSETKDPHPREAGSLPPLVPPNETHEDEDYFEERDASRTNLLDDAPSSEMYDDQVPKRSMGMLRLGRNSYYDDDKRSMGMLRLGRGHGSDDEVKRSMGMLRLGRGFNSEEERSEDDKRSMGMLRLGRGHPSEEETVEKKSMGMLRLGRVPLAGLKDKKSMGMLRLGKRAGSQ